jgi:3alpha(or 20beta)-hydroxysteroid dehydrogenase
MGAEHARALAARGASVVIGDLLDDGGRCRSQHRRIRLSVGTGEQSGIVNGNLIDQYEVARWRAILDVDLTGMFLGIRASVAAMTAAGTGSIISRRRR